MQAQLAGSPSDPSQQCHTYVIGTKRQTARIGEMHRWIGARDYFTYAHMRHAESTFGVGFSLNQVSWSLDGTAYEGQSGGEVNSHLFNTINGQYALSMFGWDKLHTVWNGVGSCAQGYSIRVANWQTGVYYGSQFSNTPDGLCNLARYGVTNTANTHYLAQSQRAYDYRYALNIWGASLTGQSGYSVNVTNQENFLKKEWYCGENGQIVTAAPAVAVGPYWGEYGNPAARK